MTWSHFATYLPDLTWVVINPDGTASVEEGQMDADTLRTMLLGSPEQMRSPWDASVFARTDPSSLLPVNWLASILLRQSLAPGQQVRGPLVILGPADTGGEVTAIEQGLVDDIFVAIDGAKAPR
jgi:hypothetical protein